MKRFLIAPVLLSLAFPAAAFAQGMMNEAAVAEQKAAMTKFAFLHGEWRGKAYVTGPEGSTTLVQTERVGPIQDGTALVIQGQGYLPDGKLAFDALAVVSYDSDVDKYWITSWAMGRNGKFPIALTKDGFTWETPAPGGSKIRYEATVKDGKWHEIGTFEREGAPGFVFIDMTVERIGDSSWPAAGAVSPAGQ